LRESSATGELSFPIRRNEIAARNLWDGRWWVHVRFCSTHCEARHELERYDAKAHRWRIILAR
jgi:hypothetical protein